MSHSVVFMGTAAFAVPVLRALADGDAGVEVAGVVTQPDRPAGRGRRLTAPPVKEFALERKFPLLQPRSLRTPEAMAQLRAWAPEVIVVAAFGQILRQEVLDLPPFGCLNLHASLLPRWRGAAPVAAAIMAGDAVTGVTLMRMDAGLDTGPILAQHRIEIVPDDTTRSLGQRLAELAAELVAEALPRYLRGELPAIPQPDQGVTVQGQFTKQDGWLDWQRSAIELERQTRALIEWPGVYTCWRGQQLNVVRAEAAPEVDAGAPAGTVFRLDSQVAVATGSGALILHEIQLQGRRALDAAVFVHGQREFIGSILECQAPTEGTASQSNDA